MRIGIVDDERPARSELRYLLEQTLPEAEIVEAESGEKILEVLQTTELDACFVDINLNGMNGTTLASMMKHSQPGLKLVFATAYPDYAVKAFQLGAVDYLLKPFDIDRVQETVKRLQEGMESAHVSDLHKIMVQGGDRMLVLDVKDIVYIETENRSCHIYTAGKVYTTGQTLNYYENRLEGDNFFRIHKSYLVNLDYLKELIPYYNNGYGIKLKGYEKNILPVGRTQIRLLRQRLE